jgi:hypothetical protein
MKAELESLPSGVFQYDGQSNSPSGDVVFLVNRDGLCRAVDANLVHTEHWRVQDAVGRGAVPDGVSKDIVAAPARGPVREFREGYWAGDGLNAEWRTEPYRSGCAGKVRDIFDTMTDQATRRGGKAPFDVVQVHVARQYRELNERVASAGIKCSRAFNPETRGTGKVDFMDAFMADTQILAWYHRQIGTGVAKNTKRNQEARQGDQVVGRIEVRLHGRKLITVRTLVDEVCIHEKALSAVLRAHGWRDTGKNVNGLRDALRAALTRMAGF